METEKLLTGLLIVLVVVSAIQAYQLINLKDAISSGTVAAASSAPETQYSSGVQSGNPSGAAATSTQSPLSALDNAPNMVGGC